MEILIVVAIIGVILGILGLAACMRSSQISAAERKARGSDRDD